MCDDYDYLGSRRDGGFAQYCVAPAENLVRLPEGLSPEAAAMVEPSAVALHGLRTIRIEPGDKVAIFGAGPVGCMMAQFARIMGAGTVVVIDVVAERLSYARKTARCETMDARYADPARLRAMSVGTGFDVAVEAAGAAATLVAALECARKAGRVLILGNPSQDALLPKATISRILRGELEIRGAWNADFSPLPRSDWETVVEAFARGLADPTPLITHRLPLEEAIPALVLMHDKRLSHQKVMFCFSQDD